VRRIPTDPTTAPGDLDAQAKRLYYRLRKYLQDDFKTWHDGDREMLAQTCRYAQRARMAREATYDADTGAVVFTSKGYKGQEVPSPAMTTAAAAEKSFVDGLKELGFTPAARKRMELEVKKPGGGKFGGLGRA
jgi:P27 family predicted phage terminase small subunit